MGSMVRVGIVLEDWRTWEEMGNNFILVLEIRVSGQIIFFIKPHPKPYFERQKEGGYRELAGSDSGPIPFDFGVLYLEAVWKAFR